MVGKQKIKLYKKQADLISGMCGRQRLICLAARQCGKSTAYTVFSFCPFFILVYIFKLLYELGLSSFSE